MARCRVMGVFPRQGKRAPGGAPEVGLPVSLLRSRLFIEIASVFTVCKEIGPSDIGLQY